MRMQRMPEGNYRNRGWEIRKVDLAAWDRPGRRALKPEGPWVLEWCGCHVMGYEKLAEAKRAADGWDVRLRAYEAAHWGGVGVPMGPNYHQRHENAVRQALGLEPRHQMALWH